MKAKDEKRMEVLIMDLLSQVGAFDMFAEATVYVRAAAEAGGTVDLLKVGPMSGEFAEESQIVGDVFEKKYLTTFGDIEPWPEEKEYPTEEERRAALEKEKKVTHNFTLNANGWKFAEKINQLWDAMRDIAPTQAQIDQWYREEYEERKKRMGERN